MSEEPEVKRKSARRPGSWKGDILIAAALVSPLTGVFVGVALFYIYAAMLNFAGVPSTADFASHLDTHLFGGIYDAIGTAIAIAIVGIFISSCAMIFAILQNSRTNWRTAFAYSSTGFFIGVVLIPLVYMLDGRMPISLMSVDLISMGQYGFVGGVTAYLHYLLFFKILRWRELN